MWKGTSGILKKQSLFKNETFLNLLYLKERARIMEKSTAIRNYAIGNR